MRGYGVLAFSSDARRFLYQRPGPPVAGTPARTIDLVSSDLTGSESVLYAGQSGEVQEMLGASNDGTRVLLRVRTQTKPWRALLAGSTVTELALPSGEEPVAGTLSGWGNAAFLFTNTGRLLRWDAGRDTPRESIAATPYLTSRGPVSPGEVLRLEAALPAGVSWNGRLMLNENPIPVLESDASSVTVQIPWEMRTGLTLARIDYESSSPFASMQEVLIAPAAPRFASGDPAANAVLRGLKIVRGDFSGPLTTHNPCRAKSYMYT
jgi:hypothetical protein